MARRPAKSLLKTVSGRKLAGVAALLVVGNTVVFWQASTQDWTARVQDHEALAAGVAAAAAGLVDGDAHLTLARSSAPEGGYATWSAAPDEAWMHHVALAGLGGELGEGAVLRTLHLRDDLRRQVESYPDLEHPEALQVVFSSDKTPNWLAPTDYAPRMRAMLLGEEGRAAPAPEAENTDTVVGYAPLRDSVGKTVGLLSVSLPLSATAGPHALWQARLLMLLGGLTLALLVLLVQSSRRLAGGLQALEAAGARLAAGDLTTPVNDHGYTEVTAIGQVLEDARAALAHREERLRSYAEAMKRENELLQRGLDAATRRRRNALLQHSGEVSTTVTLAGETLPARLVDLSYDFVLVHARPGLAVVPGTPIDLELTVAEDRETVALSCTVQAVESLDNAVALRLGSRHSTDRLRYPRRLLALTRLRLTQRARPKKRHPITVSCAFEQLTITGTVVDLSAEGMAVMTATSPDTLAASGAVGRLRFALPGPGEPIQVRGTLLRMQETAAGTLLGFGFRFRGRRGSAAHQQSIEAWVNQRLAEEASTAGT